MKQSMRMRAAAALVGTAALAGGQTALAQDAAASNSSVEPEATAALNRMGAYLRTLGAFSLRSVTTIDEVTNDGMKLQFAGTVSMQVQRPNGLRIELDSDRRHRRLIYDGKTVTLYGERTGYYATVPAPATLKELTVSLDSKYGIRLPLADLYYWGSDEGPTAAIKEAAVIGPSKCGSAVCDHVAVRQDHVDWQVWIERGKTPLPRKLVITTLEEPSQPQYVAVMTWDVAPKFDATTFRFKAPMGAHKIPLVEE
jgi:hypothetical protein